MGGTDYSAGYVCTLVDTFSKTSTFPTILKRHGETMVVKAVMKRHSRRPSKRPGAWRVGQLTRRLAHTPALPPHLRPALTQPAWRTGSASGPRWVGREPEHHPPRETKRMEPSFPLPTHRNQTSPPATANSRKPEPGVWLPGDREEGVPEGEGFKERALTV